jgi:beta-lactamase class A
MNARAEGGGPGAGACAIHARARGSLVVVLAVVVTVVIAAVVGAAPPARARPPSSPSSSSSSSSPPGLWLLDQGGDRDTDLWGPADPTLQAEVDALLGSEALFAAARAEGRFTLALVDLSDPHHLATALVDPDREMFTASMSKIALLLGAVDRARRDPSFARVPSLRPLLDPMIKASSNEAATAVYQQVGHDAVVAALTAHRLYEPATGGLWWSMGRDRRSPLTHTNIAGTARQAARFFLLMEQGRLVSPDDSRTIKDVLGNAALALFSKGIQRQFPDVRYYGKPGIYGRNVSEAMLIESRACRYVLAIVTSGLAYEDPAFQRFGRSLHARMVARHAPGGVPP